MTDFNDSNQSGAPAALSLGDAIDRLASTIDARAAASPDTSYTAKLLAGGPHKAAKKLGEEAVEAVIASIAGDKANLADEAADVIYHLLVVLKASGVEARAVAQQLENRRGMSGHEEKASRT